MVIIPLVALFVNAFFDFFNIYYRRADPKACPDDFTHTIRISKWWLPNMNFNFVVDLAEMLGFGGGIASGGAMKTKGGLVST